MFITHIKKWRNRKDSLDDNLYFGYTYYRLSEAFRDAEGRSRNRVVMGLGELTGLSKAERNELGDLLTVMIDRGEMALSTNVQVQELALHYYNLYCESRLKAQEAAKAQSRLREAARLEAERRRKEMVMVKLSSLRQKTARTVGAENICLDTVKQLSIRQFLTSHGFSEIQTDMAIMQIIARAIYPGSELRTVRCLQENSALCELLGIRPENVNKDILYRTARKLWDVHREIESYLHNRVCNLFGIEEKIYLFDLTNTNFEGRMEASRLCAYGRSKEKRDDCKIVVLAAVVNSDGLLVRTEIFEGNRQDVTTLEEVIGSLDRGLPQRKKIIVMDAGFSSESNLQWLVSHHYDYITVMRSHGQQYTPASDIIEKVSDNKEQEIRLQKVRVEEKAAARYEEGLKAIGKGIEGKGVKGRDALQRRLGRLHSRYANASKAYNVTFEYDGKGRALRAYTRNMEYAEEKSRMHGKYLLRTSLDEQNETDIWTFYNVIRTVEETFKTLKSDLDIRPVFHKGDKGTKAHLNLAVLAYWIVSTTKYRLKSKGIHVRWRELLRIMSTQVRVSAEFETDRNHQVIIRRSTEPEEKLLVIYDALGLKAGSMVKLKSVVHPKAPPKKLDG
jgi:transposase